MKLSQLGFSTKVLGMNVIFLLTVGVIQLAVMGLTSKAITIAKSQGHRIDLYSKVSFISNKLGETRYWLNDVALTWDMESIDKAKAAQKSLDEQLASLKDEFPAEVESIEKKVAALFDTTNDAVTSFATGDREGGTKLIKNARGINDEINAAVARIAGAKAAATTENPTDEIIGQIVIISRMFWMNFGLILISGVVLWLFTHRSIVIPIRKSLDHFKDISTGNLSLSQRLSESSNKSSSGVTEQASAIQETVATLNEITAMVNRSVEIANLSAQKAEMSYQISGEGKASVDQMRGAMTAIRSSIGTMIQQMSDSNRKMAGTVAIIDKISEKTNIINDIVFQTKLLSFNASVEAARAGENGRGFAVVAEEVGNLARISGQAAQEIGTLLRTSRGEVARIVAESDEQARTWMSTGMEKIENGVTIADRCDEILTEVVENVGSVKKLMNDISSAAKEEAEGIHNITNAMNMLDSTTHLNADMAHQTMSFAGALNEQSNSLGRAVDSLGQLVFGVKEAGEPRLRVVASAEQAAEEDAVYEDEDDDDDFSSPQKDQKLPHTA